MQERKVDTRGLSCPQPVILTRKAMDESREDPLVVMVDNKTALENITKLAASQGYQSQVEEAGGVFSIYLTPENRKSIPEEKPLTAPPAVTVLITRSYLGQEDNDLGAALMKSFIYTLTEKASEIGSIIFMHAGIFLTTAGSPLLEHLQTMEGHGVNIYSCGTCLDYYGRKEDLRIGQVTNMYDAVDKMLAAGKTISI